MSTIPHLAQDKGGKFLMVDDEPFLALGGELHNSSGSDLAYMERVVWPSLRQLGGNFYLTPVYWEMLEPREGEYCFDLVDGVIDQARREGVRLGLLWFGIWKNGSSDYVPQWLKNNHELYFLFEGVNGKPMYTISPFCEKAVDLDRRAFVKLMEHIREYDGERHTVIMVQVENEIGAWDNDRDFCAKANEAFANEIPDEVAAAFHVEGNWSEAFGERVCDNFMSYYYAKAVEMIASAGKAVYPLPMFVNSVVEYVASRPIGAPDALVFDMWMKFTPSIDFYSPDIYVPWFKRIVDAYHTEENPLFIPETGGHKDACSNFIYALGKHNCMGFNPFAIERLFMGENPLDPFFSGYRLGNANLAGQYLRQAYQLAWAIWKDVRKAHCEGRIHAYLDQTFDESGSIRNKAETLNIQVYRFRVNYGYRSADANTPHAAGMIIELGRNEFMFFGVNSSLTIEVGEGKSGTVFISDKYEYYAENGKLVRGRNLNGDERMFTGCTQAPGVFKFRIDCFS